MTKEDKGSGKQKASNTDAVIDRIEDGDMAVLLVGEDSKTQVDVPLSLLPQGAEAGDHLRIRITIDSGARASAEERIKKLQEQLNQESDTQEQKDFKL